MKKIVLFINGLSSGGAERQLCELANGLAERGYCITITTYSDTIDHYKYNELVKRKRIAPRASKFVKILGIWKYFLTLEADWVITFGQRASFFCLIPLYLFSQNKIHVIAGERFNTIGKPSIQEKILMAYLYKRVDYIVPNSYSQRKHIITTKPIYEAKTITITNYTDLSHYKKTPLPNGKKLRIIVVGRYNEQKNGLLFVEAVNKLKNDSKCDFVIEWYGNQHYKDTFPNPYYVEMQNKVNEYGLGSILVLNDHVKDIASVLAHFDVFCLPSLREGFSNALGESICCGRPCLVSDVSDNGLMVKHGINGFLFNPKDINSIVEAFQQFFMLDKKDRILMGNASRKRAEELFNYKVFIDAYVNLVG